MSAEAVPAAASGSQLHRGLNLWDVTLLVLGLVLGGGIFLTPPSIAQAIPSAKWILAAWVVGGVLSIFGGFVYSELGAMKPEAGGMYIYIRDAFGPFPAFLYAWVAYFVILAGADAAVAVGFAEYFSVFFPALGTKHVLFTAAGFPVSAGQLVAVAAVLVLSATHYVGIREGSRVQGVFTLLIVIALLWLVVGGAIARVPAATTAAATPPVSGPISAAAFGCLSAGIVPGPRIVWALAQDRLFPRAFARVHPRFRTPSFAIAVQAVWMSLLCLSGRYDQLYTYATFAVILAYLATGLALFVFRRTLPRAPRPYRCWGYPIVPGIFVASSLLLALNTVRQQPRETLSGLAILAAGVPVYLWMRAGANRRRTS